MEQPRSSHAQQAAEPPADAPPRVRPRSSSASTEGCGLLDSSSKMTSCRWACGVRNVRMPSASSAPTGHNSPRGDLGGSDSALERAEPPSNRWAQPRRGRAAELWRWLPSGGAGHRRPPSTERPDRGFEQHGHPGRGAGRRTDHARHERRRRASKRRAERRGAPEEERAVCGQCDAAGASGGGHPQTKAALAVATHDLAHGRPRPCHCPSRGRAAHLPMKSPTVARSSPEPRPPMGL